MNYEQFAIWLHGFLEISNAEEINKDQTQIIKDHLALLFEKKTTDRSKKKEINNWEEIQRLIKESEKDYPKEIKNPYITYPAPMPIPTYPGFNPHKITCTELHINNLCNEGPLSEPFNGVNLNTKFDTELHKTQTYC
jgi:hypothetical protein